jgi:hypothetical protein
MRAFSKKLTKKTNDIVIQHNYQLSHLTQPNNYTPHMIIYNNKDDVKFIHRINNSNTKFKKTIETMKFSLIYILIIRL